MLNLNRARKRLQNFQFQPLFIEELGWDYPPSETADQLQVDDLRFTRQPIAQLGGVMVYQLLSDDGSIPPQKIRRKLHGEISRHVFEHLLIFIGQEAGHATQTVWSWEKHEGHKRQTRSHHFMRNQTGDLFLSKIAPMFVDLSDLDAQGNISVAEVANRLRDALDIERVTKKFFDEFQYTHGLFLEHIQGIDDEKDRRWYTSVVLNRVMFTYFLQKKGFIDQHKLNYLQDKLTQSQDLGQDRYFKQFLQPLFFEGFAKPESQRDPATQALLGQVSYLNGGLFLPHPIEEKYGQNIHIPDAAFESLFAVFNRYSWNLDDSPGGQDDEINPDVLGYIFEKYINQKEFGAYYTRPEITEYLCEQTIHRLVLDKLAQLNQPVPGLPQPPSIDSLEDLYRNLDADRCKQLLHQILPSLSLLDPACGSGAFLVAALKTMQQLYQAVIGRIPFLKDTALQQWYAQTQKSHPSLDYFVKKQIITQNLYGVDIMAEAVEIARLRLFLALVASAQSVDDLEPLPNIDFNILPGNSLIGILRVDESAFAQHFGDLKEGKAAQLDLFGASTSRSYRQIVDEKNSLIRTYQQSTSLTDDLQSLRDAILAQREQANHTLNQMLLDEFQGLKIQFEQATWDNKKNKAGKAKKRPLTLADMEALDPFHWGYEFDRIMNERGGFDAIIANPPWEIFKPIAKEFCYDYDPDIERRGTDIKDFNKRLKELLKDAKIREQYLAYQSKFPHVSAYLRSTKQFENQATIVNGRKTGSDVNLYKLFLEQSYNLLKQDGLCGIVIPSGIYSDLGATGLREMLFNHTQITALFGLENRKKIFEGVHRSFKIVVLSFRKGGKTEAFPATFMRHNVEELNTFPDDNTVSIKVDMLHKLSPGSLSVMEFTSPEDVQIAEKMSHFPNLGEDMPDKWNISFTTDLHMTNDSDLFMTAPNANSLPLYEGKMIWHFEHGLSEFRYWVDRTDAEDKLFRSRQRAIKRVLSGAGLKQKIIRNQVKFGHDYYRLGYRAVTGATNERALVVSIIPRYAIAGNSLIVSDPIQDKVNNQGKWVQEKLFTEAELLVCQSLMASFVCDWFMRQKILTNMNMFYIYQLPVPRLTEADPQFAPIVERAARLICTTPEYDELAQAVGLGSHQNGASDAAERAQLRAELDGLIAQLYGLSEGEFQHILSTFPLVDEQVKEDALAAYRQLA